MRYYDKTTHTETDKKSSTTIPQTDDRVKDFFKQLEGGHRVIYIDDLPVIEPISLPTREEVSFTEAKELENQEWQEYLYAEKANKKEKWIKAGKPKFK